VGTSLIDIEATTGDNVEVDTTCVAYSLDDGQSWTVIACGVLSFPYSWDVPEVESDSCRVRVTAWDAALNVASDTSDSTFAINTVVSAPDVGLVGGPVPVLLQNHPNPVRARSTLFSFYLPEPAEASLTIFDLSGRMVRTLADGFFAAGVHEFAWDGADNGGRRVSEGIYFYVLQTPESREMRKLVKLN
jgi:hypothetical protein